MSKRISKKQRKHVARITQRSVAIGIAKRGSIESNPERFNSKFVNRDLDTFGAMRRRLDQVNADRALARELREVWE